MMSKFPNKTPHALREYFQSCTIEQLITINHEYGPHFERLGNNQDHLKASIEKKTQLITSLQQRITRLNQELPQIRQAQVFYEQDSISILDEHDTAERSLALKSLGRSPMERYNEQESSLNLALLMLREEIQALNEQLKHVNSLFSRACSELRILNSVIDQMRSKPESSYSSNIGMI